MKRDSFRPLSRRLGVITCRWKSFGHLWWWVSVPYQDDWGLLPVAIGFACVLTFAFPYPFEVTEGSYFEWQWRSTKLYYISVPSRGDWGVLPNEIHCYIPKLSLVFVPSRGDWGVLLNEENTQIIGSFLFPYPPEITKAYYTDKYASEVSNLEDFSSPPEVNGVSYWVKPVIVIKNLCVSVPSRGDWGFLRQNSIILFRAVFSFRPLSRWLGVLTSLKNYMNLIWRKVSVPSRGDWGFLRKSKS